MHNLIFGDLGRRACFAKKLRGGFAEYMRKAENQSERRNPKDRGTL